MVDFSPFRFLVVIALFAGHILLLAPIFDRMRKRKETSNPADPDLASLEAELLARRLGQAVLWAVGAVAWLSGLAVLPLLIAFVYNGWWLALPITVAVTFASGMVSNWIDEKQQALKGGLLSKFL